LPAISKTSEREEHFLFSNPYYFYRRVIVTRDSESSISGIDDLESLTVSVQINSSHHSYLLSYPNINLSLYDSVEDALVAVANGTERVFVGNLATTNYLIKSNALTDLKFIAFEAEKEQAIYFATNKDNPELISIFNKVLDTITEEEKIAIQNKWIDLESEADYSGILRIVFIVASVLLLIIAVSLYWVVLLKKEAKKRELVQKDLEKARIEAERANQIKSSFLARMSHEIRTPINAISGMTYLLKDTQTTSSQEVYLDNIKQASDSMLSIINDILDFSKIEAGKVDIEITSFNLDKVIKNVINIVSYNIDNKKVSLKVKKDINLPNWYLGDGKRIEQILLNLLNNAAKFTDEGEIILGVKGDKQNRKNAVQFYIKDSGIGMSQEQVNNLFKPFMQGDSSINRRFGGSGLGLSIVKNLVDLMGGLITVESELGKGSTFIVNLPLEVDDKKENGIVQLPLELFKNANILIVSKDKALVKDLKELLLSFGFSSGNINSEITIEKKLENKFDLFIIDYESFGFKTTNIFKKIESNNLNVLVIVSLKLSDVIDELNSYDIEFVTKPIIPSVLYDKLLDLFNIKNSYIDNADQGAKKVAKELKNSYLILLAEDNKTNQLIAQTFIEKAGFRVIIANNGHEAVELFAKNKDKIDLVLMDLHMPIMNGYEASKRIKEESNSIPIIAMTADVIAGVKEKCEESGMTHYISKPFSPNQLIESIRGAVEVKTGKKKERVLDFHYGFESLGGNEEVYKLVLSEFYKENKNYLKEYNNLIEQQKYEEVAQLVHKIKGSLGSIGAIKLYKMSQSLQKSLLEKDLEEVTAYKEMYFSLFEQLMDEIKEYIETN